MSDSTHRSSRSQIEPGWTIPIATWEAALAEARARTAALREHPAATGSPSEYSASAVQELSLTYEELAVAEEELRAQNEELQRAQTAIAQERLRYSELFLQAPVPYVVTDANGAVVEANRATSDLLRCEQERLVRKPLAAFTHDKSRRRFRDVIRRLSSGESVVTCRFNLRRRDGELVPVEATAAAARALRGDLLELRWLLIDQRPRRRLEAARRRRAAELEAMVAQRTHELQRAQRLKDQLVATVSHELRTPLAAIGGYAELLLMGLRGPVSDAQRSDLQRMQRACEHLAGIVDDLLDFSRLAAKTLSFDIQDTPVADALRAVVDLIAPQAAEAHVSIDVAISPRASVVRADPERLRQIVLNLVGNAVKFTPPGGTVRIRSEITASEVIVAVEDMGPGIRPEEREAIFEPFVRLRPDSSIPGAGLGLTISRDMARAMSGDLTVTSGPQGGSCFALRLPLSTRLAGN